MYTPNNSTTASIAATTTTAMATSSTTSQQSVLTRILYSDPWCTLVGWLVGWLAGIVVNAPETQTDPNKKNLLVLLTSDRGLCGSVNSSLVRATRGMCFVIGAMRHLLWTPCQWWHCVNCASLPPILVDCRSSTLQRYSARTPPLSLWLLARRARLVSSESSTANSSFRPLSSARSN
jgi:hypothetical protein